MITLYNKARMFARRPRPSVRCHRIVQIHFLKQITRYRDFEIISFFGLGFFLFVILPFARDQI